MAQPDYVPLVSTDQVRPLNRLQVPGSWEQDRPAEIVSLRMPVRPAFRGRPVRTWAWPQTGQPGGRTGRPGRGTSTSTTWWPVASAAVAAGLRLSPFAGHLRHGVGVRAVGLLGVPRWRTPEDLVAFRQAHVFRCRSRLLPPARHSRHGPRAGRPPGRRPTCGPVSQLAAVVGAAGQRPLTLRPSQVERLGRRSPL